MGLRTTQRLGAFVGLTAIFSTALACASDSAAAKVARGPHAAALPTVPQASAHRVQGAGTVLAPYNLFYGVYVGGNKVGFMQATYETTPVPTVSYKLEAQVRGMGRTAKVTVEETRTYDPQSRMLATVAFSQTADSGALVVKGQRRGKEFACTTTAGGADHQTVLKVTETLDDALALYPLVTAKRAKVGDHTSIKHFDAQAQAMTDVLLHIDAVQEALVAGVASRVFTVTTTYKAMGVKEQSIIDATGKLMSTQMGGFFEARLEPEEVAKKVELAQDMLLQAVVKAPKPLAQPSTLQALSLTMSGFDDMGPPSSQRQRVQRCDGANKNADCWTLTLHKDAPVPPLPYPAPPTHHPEEQQKALAPTAFVQSSAPDIVRAAQQAVKGARTMPQAIDGLVQYVQGHMRPEYVPAFSNALEALHSGRGDCTEYSVLFVALARAAGLPARVAVGVAYWPPGEGFGWHAWAEVFVDNRWISVDPTWGQTISDVTHLKFAEGHPSEQARVVMLLGRLRVTAMHD